MTIPPLLFAILMWFIGTAAVVWLDSRPRSTFGTSLTLAGLVAIVGAISVTAITLYAVRAATLGFGIGLALMLLRLLRGQVAR